MRPIFPCVIALLVQPLYARDAYQVHQENRNYEAWRDKAFFGSSSSSSSSNTGPTFKIYQPPPKSSDDYAAEANRRFNQERMREEAEYNARVARENARIQALNQRYAQRANLNQLALAGNVAAMRLLAQDVLSDAAASARDKQSAASWMAEAAAHHDPEAMKYVAMITEARRREKAEAAVRERNQLWERARLGEVKAMHALGVELFEKTTPELHRGGLDFLRKCIEHGDDAAMAYIANNVRNEGAMTDDFALFVVARDYLGRLPGHAEDAFLTGQMHLSGGAMLKPDRAAAVPYLEKAAELGYADAFFCIARAYDQGEGGPRDAKMAAQWYRKALGHEHVEFAISDGRTARCLTRVLLEPELDPIGHSEELLSLWDKYVMEAYSDGQDIAVHAADALASGVLGVQDLDREILYLSRAVNGRWVVGEEAEQRRLCARFADYLTNRFKPGLKIIVRDGNRFKIREAQRVDRLLPLWISVCDENAQVETCRSVASLALSMSEEELKLIDQPGIAAFMFEAVATSFDDANSWYESGRLRLLGKGVPRDFAGAHERLLKAWEKGYVHAALYLAILQQKKWLPNASPEQAEAWIKKGAEKNDPECMRHYGSLRFMTKDGAPKSSEEDRAEGISWWKKAIEAGAAGAMEDLADVYESGAGAPKDDVKAVELLIRASDAGQGSAKRKLATRMAEGRGVPKDQAGAVKLMFDAAQTDMLAAGNLGVVLWRGDWGEKDVANGLQWMEVALERGFWPAGRNLAKIHHLGLGIPADEQKARAFLERAGEIGGTEAEKAIADLYAKGEVIAQDAEAAATWRAKAESHADTRL